MTSHLYFSEALCQSSYLITDFIQILFAIAKLFLVVIVWKSFAPTFTAQSIPSLCLDKCIYMFIYMFFLCPIETGLHIYSGKDFDKHGVVYALQNNGITATRSSGKKGQAEDVLKNEVKNGLVCATDSVEDSWWCVDLTENYALYLTHYTLRHGQEQRTSFLYNWRLEGSVDGYKWTVLKNHKNDHGLITSKSGDTYDKYSTYTWAIDGELKAFRYFRIFQTGFNF